MAEINSTTKERILVVEDERIIAMGIRNALRKLGYVVPAIATSGQEAISKATETQPDLVLMDIQLKGDMDGVEAADTIRSRLQIPVVYLTANADRSTLERAKTTQPFGFIVKPFTKQALQTTIEIALYKHRMDEMLRQSEERYALAVRGANDGLWDWDLTTNEVYFSPRWKAMLGFQENEISNDPIAWLGRVHPDDLEQFQQDLVAHLQARTSCFENEHRILHRDGTYRWVLARGVAVRHADGVAYRMAGSQTDITDRKRLEQRLLYDALHDPLTGIPNRALFIDRLGHAVARAMRNRDYRFAVLFLDFNQFKSINDRLGHVAGDQLLVAIAQRLQTTLRAEDTVARLGGDEFTILLENVVNLDRVTHVTERIRTQLSRPYTLSGTEVSLSVSIGVVLSTAGHQRPEDILRDADNAMYRAKALGTSQVEIFDPDADQHEAILKTGDPHPQKKGET